MAHERCPKRLTIQGKLYRVQVVDKVDEDENGGEMSKQLQRILLGSFLTFDHMRETFIHEILHAIDEEMGLNLDETMINSIGVGLYQVWSDNPKLRAFLAERRPKEEGNEKTDM